MGHQRSLLTLKIKSHEAIPVNVLLQGNENWSGNKNDIVMIEAFYHKAMHRIFKVMVPRVKEEQALKANKQIKFKSYLS